MTAGTIDARATRASALTYLATRQHPTAGLLLKVGLNSKASSRCSSLGAKQLGPLLPHHCEAEIKRLLHHRRVWDFRPGDPSPIFTAASEWFYTGTETRDLLRRYLSGEVQM